MGRVRKIKKTPKNVPKMLGQFIDENTYKFMASTFYDVKTSESWRGRTNRSYVCYKEEKEALNNMGWYLLLFNLQENSRLKINYDACIAYGIKRLVRKAYTWDSKPENMEYIRNNFKHYDEEEAAYIRDIFVKGTSEEWVKEIELLAEQISPTEEHLFEVAKAVASWIEFKQLEDSVYPEKRAEIEANLIAELKKCNAKDYVSEEFYKLLWQISYSRNVVRWQGEGYNLACNILCHMLETAVFAYFMANEYNARFSLKKYFSKRIYRKNFSPAEAFLIGLYHDISEIWTDDIPSPCKRIGSKSDQTLRGVSEKQEKEALEKYFYSCLSPKVVAFMKKNVMLVEIDDEDMHKLSKNADYFSADYECYWQIVKGSRNIKFMEVMEETLKTYKKTDAKKRLETFDVRTPTTYKLLKHMYNKALKDKFLEP